MRCFDLLPESQRLAEQMNYQIREFELLTDGRYRYPFHDFPDSVKDLIRRYNKENMTSRIREAAKFQGVEVGGLTRGPDLIWIGDGHFFTPRERCHVLIAVPPPTKPATGEASVEPKVTTHNRKSNAKADFAWQIGRVYVLNECEDITVSGSIAFIGMEYKITG